MSESTLLVVFISFIAILLILIVVLRKISVRDIFEDDNSTSFMSQIFVLPKDKSTQINTPKNIGGTEKKSAVSKETIHKISKAISVIGAIILFTPTPESFKSYGLGLISLGWILSKATEPPKKAKNASQKNTTAQKIRLLADKPEYQAALKLLSDDYRKKPQATETEKYQRAVKYLQGKGVSPVEARENLRLLFTLLTRQKK